MIHIIVCPICGTQQKAEVPFFGFFCDYTHKCEHCGHIITESEWEEV